MQFFFVSGQGWEFLAGEDVRHEFPVRAVWGVWLEDKEICLDLTGQMQTQLATIYG